MRVDVAGVDRSTFSDVTALLPESTDLGQQIGNATIVLEDETGATITEPKLGAAVSIYDDDAGTQLRFGGRADNLRRLSMPGLTKAWGLGCVDWNIRAFETATGSLNKSGVLDQDRNFVIAIFRDALKAQTFGSGTGLDDGIIPANEPDWSGVRATAYLAGFDFSYLSPKACMDKLVGVVPNVSWRIRPDKVLEYGRLRTLAPFAVSSDPDDVSLFACEGYEEEERTADHRNKARRGGAAASEATFFDENSYARYGGILDTGYKNDTSVPASDVQRRAYAEGKSLGPARTARFTVRHAGLKAGQLLPIQQARLGRYGRWPQLNTFASLMGRSSFGKLAANSRGRLLVTKVAQRWENGKYVYDIEAGTYRRDFATHLADLSAAGT